MSAIHLEFNKKSLNSLTKNLEKIQKEITSKVNRKFLELSLLWLKEKSINNLDNSFPEKELSSAKTEIISSFTTEIVGETARLINNHKKAVYIEFGVGIIGQGTHNASESAKIGGGAYKYNMPSQAKEDAKSKTGHSDSWFYRGLTQGNRASAYMYNAFMDYYHGGEFRRIYEQAFSEVVGKMKKK